MTTDTPYIPFLDLGRLNAHCIDEINATVTNVVRSGRYIGGPVVEQFEHDLSSYQDGLETVAVSNGLDALRLILSAYIELGRMQHGDEVIVPANTYIASVLAISQAGLTPVLVEPDAATLNLDSRLIEDAVTERTRAIMIVHLYGRACWDEELVLTARRHKLLIVEDNAQGIGSQATIPGLNGSYKTGSLGHAAAFSFYPTKNLGAMGDAGAVVTADRELARTVRAIANYGSDRRYHNIYRGLNCRMDPIQAAILSVKLKYLDRENDRRRDIAALYKDLVHNEHITLCTVDPASATNYHQLIARTAYRDDLIKHLAALGIGTDIHYATPPHRQPCYAVVADDFSRLGEIRIPVTNLPVTDLLADSVLSLPIAPYLTDPDIRRIASALNSFTI